jgi:rod shape-determining protein MreC
MAVVASQGLVGRVHHVAPHTSEMLLITDINSRIAVSVQGTHEHALAAGNGHDQLELRYLPKHSTLKKGDVIVTSGDADLMPAGIPVGRVISVSEEGVKVQPFAPLDALDYVSVLSVE